MKRVATNMTLGQVLFVFLGLVLSSLMFFYLGAKFGPQLINSEDHIVQGDTSFLPDPRLAQEIQQVLADKTGRFSFHQVVLDKGAPSVPDKLIETPKSTDSPDNDVTADAEIIAETKSEPVAKTDSPAKVQTVAESDKPATVKTAPTPTQPKVAVLDTPAQVVVKKTAAAPTKIVEPQDALLSADEPASVVVSQNPSEKKSHYRLQIGSFADRTAAEQSAKNWANRGFPAKVITTNIPGKGQWYRLQVGSYSSSEDVRAAQQRIQSKYHETAMILAD